jgi:hypothetical protein
VSDASAPRTSNFGGAQDLEDIREEPTGDQQFVLSTSPQSRGQFSPSSPQSNTASLLASAQLKYSINAGSASIAPLRRGIAKLGLDSAPPQDEDDEASDYETEELPSMVDSSGNPIGGSRGNVQQAGNYWKESNTATLGYSTSASPAMPTFPSPCKILQELSM